MLATLTTSLGYLSLNRFLSLAARTIRFCSNHFGSWKWNNTKCKLFILTYKFLQPGALRKAVLGPGRYSVERLLSYSILQNSYTYTIYNSSAGYLFLLTFCLAGGINALQPLPWSFAKLHRDARPQYRHIRQHDVLRVHYRLWYRLGPSWNRLQRRRGRCRARPQDCHVALYAISRPRQRRIMYSASTLNTAFTELIYTASRKQQRNKWANS